VPVYAFEDFEIDLERFELRRNGEPVSIGPRPFDVLAYLIRNRQRAVSKQELVAKVWGVVALSPAAVPTCIGEVRRALGDIGGPRALIVTVPKRGYRFAATVRLLGDPEMLGAAPRDPNEDPLRAANSPYVGRERELAEIEIALAEAQAGRPRLTFLAGEAGIGKTRTAEELLARARIQGCAGIISRCHEGDGAPAFWPWEQIVRSSVELCMRSGQSAGIEQILSVLGPLLSNAPGRTTGATPSLTTNDPQAPRFRLFDAVARLLERASERQPLVIVIDDLHRADPASVQLLAFVIRELREAQVLIVGTYRDAELPSQGAAGHVFASLIREPRARVLVLAALTVQDVARYLAAVQPRHAEHSDLPTALHDRSGGNPFFLTQLVHLMGTGEGSHSDATPSHLPLTRGVRHAIAAQIANFPESTRKILVAASVIGREFNLNELSAALAIPIDAVLSAMDVAREGKLVAELLGRPRTLRFVHVLLRDALYDGIEAPERCALHRAFAEAIERLASADLDSRAPELAYHFLNAAPLSGGAGAIRYSIRAGRRAALQLAFEDAARHYRTAIDLIGSDSGATALERCDLLLALGEAELRAGERDASRITLNRVAEIARSVPSFEVLARAALGLSPGLFAIEGGVVDPLLISLLEEAIAGLGTADSSLRASLLARLAIALVWSNAEERRESLTQEAIAVARRVGDPETLGLALIARHGVTWPPERLAERRSVLDELECCAEDARSDTLLLLHRVLEIALHFELGDVELAYRKIDAFARTADYRRDPHARWYVELFACVRASIEGRNADSAEHARLFLEHGRRVADVNAVEAYGAQLVARCWDDGRPETLIPGLQEMVLTYPTLFAWKGALALSYFYAGRTSDARREYTELASEGFHNVPWNETGGITLSFLAELAALFEERSHAKVLYERLQPASSHFIVVAFAAAFRGSIARPLALLSATLGRDADAETHFEFAIQQNARVGAPFFVAQTQYDYARFLLRRGAPEDRARAESLAGEALATATRLEFHGLSSKLTTLRAEYQMEPAAAS
jgi:DNA-binding winged helix-turn-helix (wHTH) protein